MDDEACRQPNSLRKVTLDVSGSGGRVGGTSHRPRQGEMQMRWKGSDVRRRTIGAAVAAVTMSGVLVLDASTAGAVSAPEVVAEGLNSPYKLSFDDGDLYVAESGTGGDGPCVTIPADPDGPPSGESCFGPSGSVTRVVDGDGAQSRVVEGLASTATGEEVVGPNDVEVADDGTMYVTVGLGGNIGSRAAFGAGAAQLGTIVRVPVDGAPVVHADLAAFEAQQDPDAEQPGAEGVGEGGDSNPFDAELLADGTLLAVDAGGNDVLRIPQAETIEVVALLPFGEADAPPFIPVPPGTKLPVQPVPTAVERASDGTVLVTELTGFPFPAGAADLYEVVDGGAVSVGTGFSAIMDVAHDEAGNLYVAELAHSGLLAGEPDPRIIQVRPDGTRKTILGAAELQGAPTGLEVGPDGQLYVSLGLAAPGEGRVIRVDPASAADAAAAPACPPALVPGTAFADIAESPHREAVECLAWWDVITGATPESFLPAQLTTRGQLASMVARLLQSAGVDLPAAPADAFTDDDASVHEQRIDQLAALGILRGYGDGTFRPGQEVSRAAVTTMVVGAYESAFGDLVAGPDAFSDDDGSVHEASINAAAQAGWVTGVTAGTFEPDASAQRAQIASKVARVLGTLVADEGVELPS